MWVENLQQWLEDAREEEKNDATNWIRVIELVHTTFQDGRLYEESVWHTMLIMTKRGEGGLVDSLCGGPLEDSGGHLGPPPRVGNHAA